MLMRHVCFGVTLLFMCAMVPVANAREALASQGLSVLKELLSDQPLAGGNAAMPSGESAVQEKPAPVEPPPPPVHVSYRKPQVCASPEALERAIMQAVAPYKFVKDMQEAFAEGEPLAAIGESNGQFYLYFLATIEDVNHIAADEMEDAIIFNMMYALLPPSDVVHRTTFYQRGSKLISSFKGEKDSLVISWYMNNEKKVNYISAPGNHYYMEQVTTDDLSRLDRMSFHFFDLGKVENLATFVLNGNVKTFLFFGRVPVEKQFVAANRFPDAQ